MSAEYEEYDPLRGLGAGILGEIHQYLLSFTTNPEGPIHGIRQKLESRGLKLLIRHNITLSCSLADEIVKEFEIPSLGGQLSQAAELEEARGMGFGLEEAIEIQKLAQADSIEILLQEIEINSLFLKVKARNYCLGYINAHYQEFELGPPAKTQDDPIFERLAADAYWQEKINKAIAAAMQRTDRVQVLINILTSLVFAQRNT